MLRRKGGGWAQCQKELVKVPWKCGEVFGGQGLWLGGRLCGLWAGCG